MSNTYANVPCVKLGNMHQSPFIEKPSCMMHQTSLEIFNLYWFQKVNPYVNPLNKKFCASKRAPRCLRRSSRPLFLKHGNGTRRLLGIRRAEWISGSTNKTTTNLFILGWQGGSSVLPCYTNTYKYQPSELGNLSFTGSTSSNPRCPNVGTQSRPSRR